MTRFGAAFRGRLVHATAVLLLWFFFCAATQAQSKFEIRYFYDKHESELNIREMKFLSAGNAIAVAILQEKGRTKGALVVSRDGGTSWNVQEFQEVPRSLFFLDDSLGWIVTEKGIWRSEEGGRSWRKVKSIKNILRVYFWDANRGIAVGVPKVFLSTTDGGKNWTKVPAGAAPETTEEHTAYTHIAFADAKNGLVAGFSLPPRRSQSDLPAWMDPEEAKKRRQLPGLLILLETHDGGLQWKTAVSSVFGRIGSLRLSKRTGIAVLEFDDSFEWPSEVYRLTFGTGASLRIFREKNRLVTDALFSSDGSAYLAAIEPPTPLRGIPIPGKIKILRAEGPEFTKWQEIEADYRAEGRRVSLAQSPDGTVWAATDLGMILSLKPPAN